jgi:hypothetical protein
MHGDLRVGMLYYHQQENRYVQALGGNRAPAFVSAAKRPADERGGVFSCQRRLTLPLAECGT